MRIRELNRPLPDEVVARLFSRNHVPRALALERPVTVAFLGPGTFSNAGGGETLWRGRSHATLRVHRRGVPQRWINAADFGVIPVENSTEVQWAARSILMPQTPLKTCGEVLVRIHHNLMASDRVNLNSIRKCSPRPIGGAVPRMAQPTCRMPNAWPWRQCRSARRASLEPSPPLVAGEMAAEHYKPPSLAGQHRDEPNNTTLPGAGAIRTQPSGQDKTSLICLRPTAPAPCTKCSPRLPSAASRWQVRVAALKVAMWEYLFFVDIDGHQDDANVIEAMAELRKIAGYVKVLGSYPKAVI